MNRATSGYLLIGASVLLCALANALVRLFPDLENVYFTAFLVVLIVTFLALLLLGIVQIVRAKYSRRS